MLFSSMVFVFLFLPLTCFAYLCVNTRLKNYVLLIAILIFYAWGEPRYLAIMLLTIIINYWGAVAIASIQKFRKLCLIVTIIVDLSFLIYFKYFNFLIDNLNRIVFVDVPFRDIIMPIGISFYTFQAMSYLIDVYRREVKVQRDILKLALYISLFPQLVAGPIVKYHDVEQQINRRKVDFAKVSLGIKRFIIGLAKKMLLANMMGEVADKIFSQSVEQFNSYIAWVGAIAYSLQLFYDFSGYSDMAIGLGLIFGFRFLENFNYPYISKSITEFWRRWHISLSTWFKEYLYVPLGGNRVSKLRNYFNLFVVFLATGIWHGASWNFVFWGLWHGFFIIFEKITGWNKNKGGRGIRFAQHLYCILVFVIGWVMFRADNMAYAVQYIEKMFGGGETVEKMLAYDYYYDNLELIVFVVSILCAMPIFDKMLLIKPAQKVVYALVNVWLIVLFVLSWGAIASSTYNPFIYFRF